jgi:hypothetical protein
MDDFLGILHPAHVEYLRHFPLTSLTYLFAQLDHLDPAERDSYLGWAYIVIINPQTHEPVTGTATGDALAGAEVSYAAFKQKCATLLDDGVIDEYLLAFLITSMTLHVLISVGDPTAVHQKLATARDFVTYLREKIGASQGEQEEYLRWIAFEEEQMAALPARVHRNYAIYQAFCEQIVANLLNERRR